MGEEDNKVDFSREIKIPQGGSIPVGSYWASIIIVIASMLTAIITKVDSLSIVLIVALICLVFLITFPIYLEYRYPRQIKWGPEIFRHIIHWKIKIESLKDTDKKKMEEHLAYYNNTILELYLLSVEEGKEELAKEMLDKLTIKG